MNEDLRKIQEKFFFDPDWKEIEKMILEYIEPLKDMGTVDTSQPAEHVKAEIIGRTIAYDSLAKFLNDTKMVGQQIKSIKTTFR